MLTAGCFLINTRQNLSPTIAIVIPARLASERLPKKILHDFAGLPMIEHVRRRGSMNSYSVPVFVASGDEQILEVVNSYGGQYVKTFREHSDGLSRVNEASESLNYSHFIVLQGDEILVLPSELDKLIEAICGAPEVKIWNQITSLLKEEELEDISIVKCLTDSSKNIFSIFRKSPLISDKATQMRLVAKICGLFAVSTPTLREICQKQNGKIQITESIEQLKFIEYGYSLRSLATSFNFPSVNTNDDVRAVHHILENSSQQRKLLNEVLEFAK